MGWITRMMMKMRRTDSLINHSLLSNPWISLKTAKIIQMLTKMDNKWQLIPLMSSLDRLLILRTFQVIMMRMSNTELMVLMILMELGIRLTNLLRNNRCKLEIWDSLIWTTWILIHMDLLSSITQQFIRNLMTMMEMISRSRGRNLLMREKICLGILLSNCSKQLNRWIKN